MGATFYWSTSWSVGANSTAQDLNAMLQLAYQRGFAAGVAAAAPQPKGLFPDLERLGKIATLCKSPVEGEADAARHKLAEAVLRLLEKGAA